MARDDSVCERSIFSEANIGQDFVQLFFQPFFFVAEELNSSHKLLSRSKTPCRVSLVLNGIAAVWEVNGPDNFSSLWLEILYMVLLWQRGEKDWIIAVIRYACMLSFFPGFGYKNDCFCFWGSKLTLPDIFVWLCFIFDTLEISTKWRVFFCCCFVLT